jgi:integrase
MASLAISKNGHVRILFYDTDKRRKAIHLGSCSKKDAETVKTKVEQLLSCRVYGSTPRADLAAWLSIISEPLRKKLEKVDLIDPIERPEEVVEEQKATLKEFLDEYLKRKAPHVKPGTVAVWRQVIANLNELMPKGIRLDEITVGHAKAFHEGLKAKEMESTTIHKRIGFARQFINDAIDWEIIPKNPFAKVKTTTPSTKSNVEVPIETIEKLMPFLDPTWQTIIALSRFGGLRCPSEVLSLKWSDIDWERDRMNIPEPKVEHHEGRGVRSCPIFGELRPYLENARELAKDGAEFVVDKQAYRDAANTGEGWKNSNLRTQFLKKLAKAGIPPWKRLFHSMRASRQTELERPFALHVVCSWLGNTEAIAKKNYLLVKESDFEKAIQPCALGSALKVPSEVQNERCTEKALEDRGSDSPTKTLGKTAIALVLPGEISGGQGIRTENDSTNENIGNDEFLDDANKLRETRLALPQLRELIALWPKSSSETQREVIALLRRSANAAPKLTNAPQASAEHQVVISEGGAL